jgi:uncharacterized integral membrane protein
MWPESMRPGSADLPDERVDWGSSGVDDIPLEVPFRPGRALERDLMSVMHRAHRPPAAVDGQPNVPTRTGVADSTSRSPSLPRTRAGTAWVGACVAAVTGLALIIFITQNVHAVDVSFLVWRGQFPLAVAMLAAALLGAVLTLVLGSTRILQLRRTARRRGERAASPAPRAQSAPAGQPVSSDTNGQPAP